MIPEKSYGASLQGTEALENNNANDISALIGDELQLQAKIVIVFLFLF